MGKELDLIQTMLEQQGGRLETLTKAVAEVGSHCAVLVERSTHLATREDVSTAIATHVTACRSSRLPKSRNGNGSMGRLIKALAAFLAVAAAALAAYFGIG